MRGSRPILFCVAAGLGVLAAGSLGGKATGDCARPFSCGAGSLPAPIVITTGRVSFRIARDGRAARVLTPPYIVAGGDLYFIVHGVLMSASGAHVRRLASLRGVGVSEDSWLQPVGRMLELEDNSRVVVVRADGSIFASIRLREWRAGGLSSSLVPAPDGSAVAFTATSGRTHATETVYVARAGARTATALLREAVQLGGCVQGASVQWLGRWLLYSDTESKLAAIDTAGGRRVLDLTRLVGRLPGIRNPFTVYWSGRSPEL